MQWVRKEGVGGRGGEEGTNRSEGHVDTPSAPPLQVMCLPMLADTSRWLKQLSRRPQVAAPVVCLLAGCHEALRANLTAFVTQQVAAVEAYAAKATAGTRREGGGWEGGGDSGGGLGAVDALFIRGGDGAFC